MQSGSRHLILSNMWGFGIAFRMKLNLSSGDTSGGPFCHLVCKCSSDEVTAAIRPGVSLSCILMILLNVFDPGMAAM